MKAVVQHTKRSGISQGPWREGRGGTRGGDGRLSKGQGHGRRHKTPGRPREIKEGYYSKRSQREGVETGAVKTRL